MSSRKKKSASSASSLPDGVLVDGGGHAPSHVPRRVWVLATLDALFAALYIGITRMVASADGRFEALTIVMGVAILAAGVGLASRRPWGWYMSIAGCGVVLAGALTLCVLLA